MHGLYCNLPICYPAIMARPQQNTVKWVCDTEALSWKAMDVFSFSLFSVLHQKTVMKMAKKKILWKTSTSYLQKQKQQKSFYARLMWFLTCAKESWCRKHWAHIVAVYVFWATWLVATTVKDTCRLMRRPKTFPGLIHEERMKKYITYPSIKFPSCFQGCSYWFCFRCVTSSSSTF